MPENEEAATEAKPEAAQASDTKAEATSTAKASDELSEDDLEAVAGGLGGHFHTDQMSLDEFGLPVP